jgi:hypothetical protein
VICASARRVGLCNALRFDESVMLMAEAAFGFEEEMAGPGQQMTGGR